jgi:hypothetical protein
MRLLTRHPLAGALVLATLAAAAAFFTFALPQYQGKYEEHMINLAEQETVSPTAVRAAFAAEGIRLRYSYDWPFGVALSDVRPSEQGRRKHIQVTVGGRTGRVDYGPELAPYDTRFENVLVTYNGSDEAMLDRVEAAVSTLRR